MIRRSAGPALGARLPAGRLAAGRLAAGRLAAVGVAATLALGVSVMTSAPARAADRSVVLAVDASGSMAGARITEASRAAQDFVAALPADVAVGVVSFAGGVTVEVEPTLDRAAVAAAITGIRPGGDTAMRDGIVAALPLGSRVVVLSDGEDTASRTTPGGLASSMAAADVPVDVIALAPSSRQETWLRAIAARSGGAYALAGEASGLAAAFAVVAQAMSTAPAPPSSATGAAVEAPPGAAPLADPGEAFAGSDTASTVQESRSWLPWVLAAITTLAVGLLVIGLIGLRRDRAHRSDVHRAIDAYAATSTTAPVRRSARVLRLEQRILEHPWHGGLVERLDLGGIGASPLAWVVSWTAAALAAGIALAVLVGSPIVGILVAASIAWASHGVLRWRGARSIRAFDAELPDLLLLLASGLRSGLSFSQALEASAVDGAGEVGRQMRRAVAETRLGTPIEEALMRTADRVRSDDLRWTVQALAMQRQVGGNLSTILETAAGSVRGRAELRREIRTLSAEGRLSAAILVGLPIALFLFLLVTRPDYVDFFWTEPLGFAALALLALLGGAGALWTRAVVRIEA